MAKYGHMYHIDMHWPELDAWYIESDRRKLDMNPDFQRGNVWRLPQRRAYVEYLLRGGRMNTTFIFNQFGELHNQEHPYVCVDGLQRLTSLHMFMHDELTVFNELTCSDMVLASKNKKFPWSKYHVSIEVMSIPTRKELLAFYLEHNSGGTQHSPEELARVRRLLAKA